MNGPECHLPCGCNLSVGRSYLGKDARRPPIDKKKRPQPETLADFYRLPLVFGRVKKRIIYLGVSGPVKMDRFLTQILLSLSRAHLLLYSPRGANKKSTQA